MNERLRQIVRVGRLVGTGLVGTRDEIKNEAMPVLEDAEQQWNEHRRRRALNGAPVEAVEQPAPVAVVTPPPPAPPGAIVVRRRIGGPP